MNCLLEICAGDIDSAIAAKQGGATRVELCSALSEGGITPSAGFAAEAANLGLTVHALIRPRGGDFLYDDAEVATMVADIKMFRQLGIDGVVIGCLTADGDIDIHSCQKLVEAAQGMSITFHRAFDRCNNPQKALEEIIQLGCHRILTSGLAATAFEGIPMLTQLVKQADGRIIIMPGCGVNADNADSILQQTGAREIHASASTNVSSRMRFSRSEVYMGAKGVDEDVRKVTDPNAVTAILTAIKKL